MDDMYQKGREQPIVPGVLVNPPGTAVQPQPISYETTPMSEDHIQNSLLPHNNVQNDNAQRTTIPDNNIEDSSTIPGGAETFIKARPSAPPVPSRQGLSQPDSPPVPSRVIFQRVHVDPSYHLLAIAIVAVLLASTLLAAFLATGSLGAIIHNHPTTNQLLAKTQATATARSTQGHTTAPQQASTPGSTQANPSATQQPAQPSSNSGGNPPSNSGGNPPPNSGGNPPPNSSGTIPIQFVNLSSPITMSSQNSSYPITVNTQPGLTITLYFTYPDGKRYDTGGPADNSGSATIPFAPVLGYSYAQPMQIVFEATVNDGNGNMGQVQATVTLVITGN